jgi:hypothetical protein
MSPMFVRGGVDSVVEKTSDGEIGSFLPTGSSWNRQHRSLGLTPVADTRVLGSDLVLLTTETGTRHTSRPHQSTGYRSS